MSVRGLSICGRGIGLAELPDKGTFAKPGELTIGVTPIPPVEEAMTTKAGNPDSKPKAPKVDHGTPFGDMTRVKKTLFIIRVMVCVLSFGFIFSNVMND
jgi:hypothetical protein